MTHFMAHVALGVGMAKQEHRDHLTDTELMMIRSHIDRALVQRGDEIPGRPGYRLVAHQFGGVLLANVGRDRGNLALCTFAVVTRSTQGAKAWQALHEGYPHYAASRGDVPRAPYCAARAEIGLAADPDAGVWLDAYQIAVAWAWFEMRGGDEWRSS